MIAAATGSSTTGRGDLEVGFILLLLSQIMLWICHRNACIHAVLRDISPSPTGGFLYHFRLVVVVRSMPPISSANSSRVNCTRPSSEVGQCSRPSSMRRAQTHRLVAIEEKYLHTVSSQIGEQKQMAALRVLLQLADHKRIESIEVG